MIPRAAPPAPAWASDVPTVGVTGTNGKTSTVSFVQAALRTLGAPVAAITTLGKKIDDDVLALPRDHAGFIETLRRVREAGGRAAIELTSEALANGFALAWPCRVGVFTNLTRDHLDAHQSAEHYLASKAQLFLHLRGVGAHPPSAVVNACDPAGELVAGVVPEGTVVRTYAVASRGTAWTQADVEARDVGVSWTGTRASLVWKKGLAGPAVIETRAIGEVFVENALAALLGSMALGADASEAARAIASCPAPAGRFEVVAERPWVVVDYAHSPDALARTLACARTIATAGVTVVFGAGGGRDRGKRPHMGRAAAGADRVVLTSDNPRDEDPAAIAAAIRGGIPRGPEIVVELDRARAIDRAVREAGPADVVIVAGKGHEAEQVSRDGARAFSDADEARAAHARRRGA